MLVTSHGCCIYIQFDNPAILLPHGIEYVFLVITKDQGAIGGFPHAAFVF